jgi:hypothetical protein
MKNISKLKLPEFSFKPRAYTGRPYDQVKAERDKYMAPGIYFHFYKEPLFIV